MVNDSDGSSPKIKVVDRRWFTEDGAPRADRSERTEQPDARPAADTAPEQPPAEQRQRSGSASPTSRDFVELVVMIAQQAELMIVGAEGLEPHPEEARRLINALGALELKTRGNLSPEESKILSEVLFQLRTLFVQGRG